VALTFTLTQKCLTNVNDAAGLWQIEGGTVTLNEVQVGTYSTVRRTDCGTTQLNTAMVWMTIFTGKSKPPENITVHGSHDMASGSEIGSVSAASPSYAAHIAKAFNRVGATVTIA
jgi:hypothetical protein